MNYKTLSVDANNISNYLVQTKSILDESIYGHNECKNYITQILAQYIVKGSSSGKVFGIQGPPGNGKTSLIKNGICKVLDRPFSMIALGGIKDGSLLEGHDFTYEGSQHGRLVQCLIDAECMNPIIYFDELDKVSETLDGQEIIGILTHLIDFTQNDKIQDRYFNGIPLDFSKCIFIFSFNDESKINPVLKDRIQIFNTKGFNENEKIVIAQNYLLPQISKDFSFDNSNFTFSDSLILYMIKKYTNNEQGVREIKKKLELILLKFNLDYLIGKNKIPFIFNQDYVDECLNVYESNINEYSHLYI
jgi:ATP-dependent Lon protease